MFPMTITLHTEVQLHAVLAAIYGATVPAVPAEPTTEQLIEMAQARAVDKAAPVWPTFEQAEANQKAEKEAAAPVEKPAPAKTARSKPTAEATAAPAQSTEPPAPQPTTAPAATASSAPEPVTYDAVAAAITAAAKVNREHAVDTLTKFGVRKGPELKPEQYASFLAALAQTEAVPA